jgi:hypothetical protein
MWASAPARSDPVGNACPNLYQAGKERKGLKSLRESQSLGILKSSSHTHSEAQSFWGRVCGRTKSRALIQSKSPQRVLDQPSPDLICITRPPQQFVQ